jgi:hypothetical protein
MPLVLRSIEGGGRDAVSPYGYPGLLVCGDDAEAFLADALDTAIGALAEERIVSLFVRCHPLLNRELPAGRWTVVTHADTVAVDLTLPPEEQWQQVRRNHRQQIRQAIEKGYVAEVDDAWQHFDTFKRLYWSTMDRVGADAYYRFDEAYFDGLLDALGPNIHLAYASFHGEIAAACLFVATCGVVEMHLTGHDERFSDDQPMKLLFDHVRRWSIDQGHEILHLGGGRGGCDDSLLHFKAGFSPVRQPYRTIRSILNAEANRALVSARDPSLDPDDTSGRFPLYR